jgi:SnoaL-like domain
MLCSLQDRAEIDDLLARYCMALDTKNWDEFPNILTEDVSWDYSAEFGTAFHGFEEVVSGIRTSIEPHPASMHVPLMTRVWSTGPDTAEGFSHVLSKSVLDGAQLPATDQTTFEVYCSWLDEYVRTPAGWRISKRTLKVMASSGDASIWDPATPAGLAFRRLTRRTATPAGSQTV